MSTYTFKVCDGATGIPYAFLPQFDQASVSFEMSDVGSLSFSYLKNGVNASTLDNNLVEIAVFQDGIEMDDGRFTIQSDSGDEIPDSAPITYTGVSLSNMLKKAIVYSADDSRTLGVDQVFVAATPGGILKALFDQNKARGTNRVMDRITYTTWDATHDSNGNSWTYSLDGITYTVGVSYLDVMRNMFDNGMIEWKMVGRDLRVYNIGTMGVDHTLDADPIVLRKGRDLIEAPRTRTSEAIAAVALVGGDQNVLAEFVDTSVATVWGEDEVFISQGGISDPTTLGILSQQAIASVSERRIENTHKIALASSPYRPYADYKTSDYIYTDRGKGLDRLRVRQIVIDISAGSATSASLVLNDKFLELDIVNSRRINGILGGATSTGSVAIPTDPDPSVDTTIPKAPAGASLSSNVYVNANGQTVAAGAVSWTAVTQNTDGSTIADLDHYEVEYKTDAAGSVVPFSALGPASDEQVLTRKFDRRGKGFGWLGADGGHSCRATSGLDFFLFADTNLGTADQSGKIGSDWKFIHNSAVLTDPTDPSVFNARWAYGNKLSANDAFQESGIGLWQADTNCAVARDTSAAFYGTASLKITATAAGDAIARIAAPATSAYSVTSFIAFSAMARVRTLSGTARNVVLSIRWYDPSNALLSTTSSTTAAGSLTSWVRYNVRDNAPAGATHATITVTIKSAAAGQVFNVDTMGLFQGAQSYGSWNDPNRGVAGGPVSLINPEDLGGTQIASGSLANTIYWVDAVATVGTKILGFMTRYTPLGVFQNTVHICQWDGTTHNFESLTVFTTGDVIQWGNTTYQDGTYLYIFGLDTTSPSTARAQHIMRVPIGNVTGGTKEYWSGSAWTTTRASSAAVYTGYANWIGGIVLLAGVFNAVITIYGEGTMRRLTASAITGPYTDTGPFYTMPNVGSGINAYFPRIHPQLSDTTGVPMSYSVNGTLNGKTSTDDIRLYAPKFLRGPSSIAAALTPLTDWSNPRIIESGVLFDNIGDLTPGYNFQARVRAVDYNGNEGLWTNTAAIRLVDDTVPPNQPSAPMISAQFKGVRIEWDGTDFQGGPPPADWAKMEVHLSEISNFQPGPLTLVDTYITRLGGVTPLQGLEYGITYYARFVALDLRGNRSTPSDIASATPQQLVDTNEIGNKLIQGANIADNTIAVKSLTVATFLPSIVPNGGFEDQNTNADGSLVADSPSFWSTSPWIIGAGGTIAYDITTPISGSKSITLIAPSQADGRRYQSAVFPVTEGTLLAASVKVRASRAIANPAFEIHIVCGDTEANTGAFPSAGHSVWGTSATITGTTGIQTLELQRIVDTGMKFARVFITQLNANDGLGGWTASFDEVSVRPVGGSAFIADASILNAKIANLAVDNAKIANLDVGKLTAGILIADITLSARIKTANTGARVEVNSSGIQAFDSGGNQTVAIDTTGAATIVGKFKTAFSGVRLEMTNATDRSTIEFYGTAAVDPAFINSPVDGSGSPRLGLNSGPFTYNSISSKHRVFMNNAAGIQIETFAVTGGVTQGGRMALGATAASLDVRSTTNVVRSQVNLGTTSGVLNLQNSSGAVDGGNVQVDTTDIKINAQNAGAVSSEIALFDDESFWLTGRFSADNPIGGKSALYCNTWALATASTDFIVSYGSTMSTKPMVLYSMVRSGSNGTGDRISAMSTTGFTVHVNSGSTDYTNLNYWCFRVI